MAITVLPISDRYRQAIRKSLFQQIPAAMICLLLLDGGRMARICGVTMIGFWAGVSLIMANRPDSPSQSDLFLIRWGFLPIFSVVWMLTNFGP